jgi:hypothetical protein
LVGVVLDGGAVKVADDGDVVLASPGRLLGEAPMHRRYRLLETESTGDGAFHEVPRRIPTGAHRTTGAVHVALSQHVNGETLEERGEAAHWSGPGPAHLDHAVLGTVDPRGLGVQAGQELTAVEMSPLALFGGVVDGKFAFTFRAGEASTSRVIHPHIDPTLLGGGTNPNHLPRCHGATRPNSDGRSRCRS